MASVDAAIATFEGNIEAQTGGSVETWALLAREQGLAKHGQMVSWLKAEHGLSHNHANHVAKRATAGTAREAEEDAVEALFAGGKESLRPIYDALVADVRSFGEAVRVG